VETERERVYSRAVQAARNERGEMTDDEKLQQAEKLKAALRALSEAWPEGITSFFGLQAVQIEARIPVDSTNQSAIEAREHCRLAKEAANDLKGAMHIADAIAHWKDFMLFDDALKGNRYSEGQRKKASLPRKLYAAKICGIDDKYRSRCNEGKKRGAIKALAAEYKVSCRTVSSIVNKKK
jgi:hypothetical protein